HRFHCGQDDQFRHPAPDKAGTFFNRRRSQAQLRVGNSQKGSGREVGLFPGRKPCWCKATSNRLWRSPACCYDRLVSSADGTLLLASRNDFKSAAAFPPNPGTLAISSTDASRKRCTEPNFLSNAALRRSPMPGNSSRRLSEIFFRRSCALDVLANRFDSSRTRCRTFGRSES